MFSHNGVSILNVLLFPCSVVEFRTEELMKKAVEKVNKHNFNGRPLKVKEVFEVPLKLQKSRANF